MEMVKAIMVIKIITKELINAVFKKKKIIIILVIINNLKIN
jgi:hypothetical protein